MSETYGDAHLSDKESKEFMDGLVDNSRLLGAVRKYKMNRSRVEIPRIFVGSALTAGDPAGKKSGGKTTDKKVVATSPFFESIVLVSSKLTLPWTVTNEFLEDHPEGKERAESVVRKLMVLQAANDLEDLAINGDEASDDALLRANDGFLKLATQLRVRTLRKREVTKKDIARAYQTIPAKYRKDASKYRAIIGPNAQMDLLLAANQSTPRVLTETEVFGIPTFMSPYVPEQSALVSTTDNLVFGIERAMVLRKTSEGREAVSRRETYYALHIRVDFLVQNKEAAVHVYTESVGEALAARFPRATRIQRRVTRPVRRAHRKVRIKLTQRKRRKARAKG